MRASVNDAYTNECKGLLFEYLLASGLAQKFNVSSKFSGALSEQQIGQLHQYETYLREHSPKVHSALPQLSNAATNLLSSQFETISDVHLVGRWLMASGDKSRGEADIVICTENGTEQGVGIKLSKEGAHINTKSGGVMSFLELYFQDSEGQRELNRLVDHEVARLRQRLFDDQEVANEREWIELGNGTRPGELSELHRGWISEVYSGLSRFLYNRLMGFYQESPERFADALAPLVGLSRSDLWQLICYRRGKAHELSDVKLLRAKDMECLGPPKKSNLENSFFVIPTSLGELQIRCKLMNSIFSTIKINCSVKYAN